MDTGIIGIFLVIINIFFSYKGFNNRLFYEGHKFEVDKVLLQKDYKRIITSGFLHIGWLHLIFNMISLLAFSGVLENYIGWLPFIIIYFTGLVGGNLLSLFVHKNHSDYSSVGASGAVCAVIFASIALFPGFKIGFFFLPLSIPAWAFGIIYVLYSIYGIRSKKDNIGHEAHLGGALIGMMMAIAMYPVALRENIVTILIIAIPTIAFILFIILKPQGLLIDNNFYNTHKHFYSIDHKYNAERAIKQKEIDRILDKINKRGYNNLNEKEKQLLKEYSKKI